MYVSDCILATYVMTGFLMSQPQSAGPITFFYEAIPTKPYRHWNFTVTVFEDSIKIDARGSCPPTEAGYAAPP